MAEEIPINKIYSHPLVKELLKKIESKSDELENIKIPYVIKNKVLMSPGVWNNYYYNPNVISEAFDTTDWQSKEIRSLFNDHEDLQSREWIGEIINPRLEGDTVMGDLVIVDKTTAQKLAYGAKMGISPKVHGQEEGNEMTNFKFDNFSVVINPAIKTAYINNKEQKLAEGITKPHGDVKYADPGYRNKTARYPVDTEAHVRAAWSYINVQKNRAFYSPEQLKNIEGRIQSAAKKFGIKIKEDNKMSDKKDTVVANEEQPEDTATEEKIKEAPAEEVTEDAPAAKEDAPAEKPTEDDPAPAETPVEKENADKPKADEEEDPKKKKGFPPKKEDPKEMAEEDIITQIIKLADMLAQRRKNLSEEPVKVDTEMSTKIDKQDGVIQTMSEKIVKLEAKLNEPEKRKSVKTEELSEKDVETIIRENPDEAFMSLLNNIGGGLQ